MSVRNGFFLTSSLLGVLCQTALAVVETYPGPGVNTYQSNLYTVEVLVGSNWLPSYTYQYRRSSVTNWQYNLSPSVNFTTFGTTEQVQVRITRLAGSITSVQVSPISKNIPHPITGGQAILTLDPNHKTWIILNGDDANPLFIFADLPKPAVPAGATYFGPGVRDIAPASNNHYQASSNEVIYLDGGAWVRGNIFLHGTTNVRIMGPGVLSGDLWTAEAVNPLHNTNWNEFLRYTMIYGDWAGNAATVSGITMLDSPAYNFFGGVTHANSIKVISPWWYNCDGFQNIGHVDQSFAFVGDNVLVSGYAGHQNDNMTFTNNFVGTSASAVFAGGYWGNPPNHNFTFLADNIDIKTYNQYAPLTSVIQIWTDNPDSSYGYKNQTYQNIRIEGSVGVQLIQLKNFVYPWAGAQSYDPPLGNIYNTTFRNITLAGTQTGLSEILGWDANNQIQGVTLENVRINGTLVTPGNVSNYFHINSFVQGLSFTSSGSSCDLNGDNTTNVSDVQLCANQAIGVTICSTGDINHDSSCNVIDVQRVVNTALGGQCVTQ